MEKKHKKLNN